MTDSLKECDPQLIVLITLTAVLRVCPLQVLLQGLQPYCSNMAATEYQLPVPSSRYHSVGCTETVSGVEGQVGEIKLVVEFVSSHS